MDVETVVKKIMEKIDTVPELDEFRMRSEQEVKNYAQLIWDNGHEQVEDPLYWYVAGWVDAELGR